MPIINLSPLTVDDIGTMNDAVRALGPDGANVITQGECNDLGEYFDMASGSCNRWFNLPGTGTTPGGGTFTVSGYRRMVPLAAPPNNPNAPYMLGRRIALTQGTAALDNLRKRSFLAAALDGGYDRDPLFHGKPYIVGADETTLSACADVMQALFDNDFGDHPVHLNKAWRHITIRHQPGFLPWHIAIFCNAPLRDGTEGSDPILPEVVMKDEGLT